MNVFQFIRYVDACRAEVLDHGAAAIGERDSHILSDIIAVCNSLVVDAQDDDTSLYRIFKKALMGKWVNATLGLRLLRLRRSNKYSDTVILDGLLKVAKLIAEPPETEGIPEEDIHYMFNAIKP